MDAAEVRRTLQAHRELLQQYGMQEVRVLGSAARSEAGEGSERSEGSDIDLLVDYDPSVQVGLFAFVRLRRRLSELRGSGQHSAISRRRPSAHRTDVSARTRRDVKEEVRRGRFGLPGRSRVRTSLDRQRFCVRIREGAAGAARR